MHWKAECDKVLKHFTQASGGQSEDVWIFTYRFQDQQIGLSRILLLEGLHFHPESIKIYRSWKWDILCNFLLRIVKMKFDLIFLNFFKKIFYVWNKVHFLLENVTKNRESFVYKLQNTFHFDDFFSLQKLKIRLTFEEINSKNSFWLFFFKAREASMYLFYFLRYFSRILLSKLIWISYFEPF